MFIFPTKSTLFATDKLDIETLFRVERPATFKVPFMDAFCRVVRPVTPRFVIEVLANVVCPSTASVPIEALVILVLPETPRLLIETFNRVACPDALNAPTNVGPVMVVPVSLTTIVLLPVPNPPINTEVVKDLVPKESEFTLAPVAVPSSERTYMLFSCVCPWFVPIR
jgi:hypothetical protein